MLGTLTLAFKLFISSIYGSASITGSSFNKNFIFHKISLSHSYLCVAFINSSFVTVDTMRLIALLTKKDTTFEISYPIQQQLLLFTPTKRFPSQRTIHHLHL